MTRPSVREQVQALVERRHAMGERYAMRARMKLALDLNVSENTVRAWLKGQQPSPMAAAAIQQRYDAEVNGG